MRKCIICDIDGTLADCERRRELAQLNDGTFDWEVFFNDTLVGKDKLIREVETVARSLYGSGYEVFLFTGRPEKLRETTLKWLHTHHITYFHRLLMREDGDFRPDHEIKLEMVESLKDWKILCVMDDRKSVVDMWRKIGLTCFQVAEGDF